MTAIRLPQLGESAAEATIVSWLVSEGDTISADQDLVEVETEKSVMTVTAPATGIVRGPLAAEGTKVAVGDQIGVLDTGEDDEESAEIAVAAEESPRSTPPPMPTVPVDPEAIAINPESVRNVPAKGSGIGYFSPRVRALMDAYKLTPADIAGIRGTGRAGRVNVGDVERFLNDVENRDTIQASHMRVAVADSMRRSWSRPLATVGMTCNLDPLMQDRRSRPGRPGATVYAIRALAIALAECPTVACRLVGERLVQPTSIDIAFAVEVPDGVRTPVIPAANDVNLEQTNQRYDELLAMARERGGPKDGVPVATISNYAPIGIEWATPVPMPEESLILGIGAVKNMPVWEKNTWGRIRGCELTVTFDHRVADGAAAGALLKRVIYLLEHPEKL